MARHARAPRPTPRGGSPQKELIEAARAFQNGDIDRTCQICTQILAGAPGDVDALNLSGAAHLWAERLPDAVEAFSRAAALTPKNAEIHTNLGTALVRQGRFADAEASLRRAIAIDPRFVRAHVGLGHALEAQGKDEAALAAYDAALAINPKHIDVHRSLADLHAARGRFDAALAHCDSVLAIAPGDPSAQNGRGGILAELGRLDEAIVAFNHAREADPRRVEVIENLASAYRKAGNNPAAIQNLHEALAIDPSRYANHRSLAVILRDLGERVEGLAHIEAALVLAPNNDVVHFEHGLFLSELGRFAQAHSAFARSIEINPDNADAHFGRGLVNLLQGNFAVGWEGYLARESLRSTQRRNSLAATAAGFDRTPLPTDLCGHRILIVGDQGLGDELFFLRYAPELKARGAWIACCPDPRLAKLLSRTTLFDMIFTGDDRIGRHAKVAVGDLPYLLGSAGAPLTPPSIRIPAIERRVQEMRDRLAACGSPPYVGVTWRAGTQGRERSISKEAPLVGMAQAMRGLPATLVALQRNPGDREVETFERTAGCTLHDFTSLNIDLEAMLALLSLLDDYVCVSNTNVHLRACQGRTCRVLVPHPPEFRWMAEGTESPWFPEGRLYRQTAGGDWLPALSTLRRDLGDLGRVPPGSTS